jgi:uncharacterized membrane protein (DUF2068 family)
MRGHVTPARWARTLRPDDAALGVTLDDGSRLCRCLRCDAWVRSEPPGADARYDVVPPPADLPRPRRGKALEDRILLRLIAVERGIHSVIFGLFALGLVLARHDLHWLVGQARELKDNTSRDASLDWFTDQVSKVVDLRGATITVLMITATIYCVGEGVEAVGLWKGKRWAEYLTALATVGFLPFELRLLNERVTILRVVAMIVNVAIVVYLVWDKRLFGLRGGKAALDRAVAASTDWDELLARAPTAPR